MTIQLSAHDFYASLGEDYDLMTGDRIRWDSVRDDYAQIIGSLSSPRILDAGCGTGGETILLASLGSEVVGVDSSPDFIALATKKAVAVASNAKFQVEDLRSLDGLTDLSFGMIVSRGNTIPHLRTVKELESVFRAMARVAEPGALLIVSWLNYLPILRDKRRIVGVTEGEGRLFVRFYDFTGEDSITFNVMNLSKQGDQSKWKPELISTELTPWSVDEVGMLLRKTGWGELEIASDLRRSEFDPDTSKDAVFYAVRDEL